MSVRRLVAGTQCLNFSQSSLNNATLNNLRCLAVVVFLPHYGLNDAFLFIMTFFSPDSLWLTLQKLAENLPVAPRRAAQPPTARMKQRRPLFAPNEVEQPA